MLVPFKKFVTEKTYNVTSKERKQIEDIFDRYQLYFNDDKLQGKSPEAVYRKNLQEDGTFFLGTITYIDQVDRKEKKLHIEVSFGQKASAAAGYRESTNSVILFYNYFSSLSPNEQRNTILHEVLHARQHYKKLRPQDIRATHQRTLPSGQVSIRSKQDYYTSPNEFPIQLASITEELQRQYSLILQHLKRGDNKKFWEKQRLGFLRLLDTFIRSSKLPKDFPLPSYLKYQEDFIRTLFRIKDKPEFRKQYRKFKLALQHYYQKLNQRPQKDVAIPEEGF
ncbi:hypothetical protein UFOVP760_87 [uncultured Caudovirales phage]|uniref:Uncharacterized protein n=1 Tax=uncultured Caudovirales phage TaxID=2100421 RepID=A0A6J7X617_9CAUD|nr:hypothetical protein UFOVP760_87 [uncultured Caudovirales phage]